MLQRAGNNKMVRRMLVADVVVGTAFRTFRSRLPEEWCPPLGYNSVVAEVMLYASLMAFVIRAERSSRDIRLYILSLSD